jgi:hypothetical protein
MRIFNISTWQGKFAAGATVGFIGSRLALGTVTKVIKLGAAAFVT